MPLASWVSSPRVQLWTAPSVSTRNSSASFRPKRSRVGVEALRSVMPSRRLRSKAPDVSICTRPLPTTSLESTKSGRSVEIGWL